MNVWSQNESVRKERFDWRFNFEEEGNMILHQLISSMQHAFKWGITKSNTGELIYFITFSC